MNSKSIKNPIIIFGSARSGTSLLSRIVGSHPNIAVPYESQIYNRFYPWVKYYGDFSKEKNRHRLVKDLLQTDFLQEWDPKPEFQDVVDNIERYDFHGIFEALMNSWVKKAGKVRWGEKTPWHMYYWKEILEGFPNAKFIYIVRDGRDASISWRTARFGPKHILRLANRWKYFLNVFQEFKQHVDPGQLFELRYEDLLENSESIVKDMCEFLDEPYSEEMLSFYKTTKSYPTDKGNDKNLTKPLMKSNKEKWRSTLTNKELRIFETIAGSELKSNGYPLELENPSISSSERMIINYIVHPILRVFYMSFNFRGHKDGLIQLFIYLRLRIHALNN